MEEIDQFIKKCKEEQEFNDYIHKNIYPESLKTKTKYNTYKPMLLKDTSSDYIPTQNIKITETIQIGKMLDKIRVLEKTLKENLHNNNNDCPICLENMGNNYVSPSCGHHICISCFTANIRQNTANCEMCCLCRRNIVEI